MAPELSFEQYWPPWPEDKASSTLVEVDAQIDASALFKHFFWPQAPFQARARARGAAGSATRGARVHARPRKPAAASGSC